MCHMPLLMYHIPLQVYPDRAARREISELIVHCPYVDTGCQWTGRLKDVEEHALQCSFKGVKCPHNGCEVWMTTSQLEDHVSECLYRQVRCKYCGEDMQYRQLAVSPVLHVTYISTSH